MSHLDTQMQMQMRLFRAQRNFYIAGQVHKMEMFKLDLLLQVCLVPIACNQEIDVTYIL